VPLANTNRPSPLNRVAFAEVSRLTRSGIRPIGRPGILLSYEKPYWAPYENTPEFQQWRQLWQEFYGNHMLEARQFAPLAQP